ncbi:MAG: hypothetical protein Fur006_50310 [Coleofasciculaceae cyanobacterium]
MNWKPIYLITSLALTVTLTACNQSETKNQIADNATPSEENNASPVDTVSSPNGATQAETGTSKTETTTKSSTNKTGNTTKSSTSNKKGTAHPCGNQITFASEETPNYRVYICATQSGVTNYVGISKKDGKAIKLPVKVDKDGNFVAKNRSTTYTLHQTGSLTVVETDKKTGIDVAVVNENGRIKPDSGSPNQTSFGDETGGSQTSTDTQAESETPQAPAETNSESNETAPDAQPDNN